MVDSLRSDASEIGLIFKLEVSDVLSSGICSVVMFQNELISLGISDVHVRINGHTQFISVSVAE